MKWLIVNESSPTPELIISGYIHPDAKVNYGDFKAAIDQLKSQGVSSAKLIVNSGGGDMVEGLAIYDTAQESGIDFDVHVVGMAASMSAILIYLGTDKPTISKHARLMFHRPQSWAGGESSTLRDRAEEMDKLEQTIKDILIARTGQSAEVVNSWFTAGKEKWFTAKEALKLGLVRAIVTNGDAVKEVPVPTNSMSAQEMWNTVYNKFLITNTTGMKYSNELKLQLGLKTDATDEQVDTHLQTIQNRAKQADTLEQAQKDQAKARAKTLVSNAITAGKLTEAERVEYEAKAEADYDFVEKTLNKVSPPTLPIGAVQNASKPSGEDRSAWTYMDWMKKDSKGLAKMQIENNAEFERLRKNPTGK